MKRAVINQRKERDALLARPYIRRQTLYNFEDLLKSSSIKLLTGPRRVGKSTRALLMLCGKNFVYLNFDDNELLKNWDESRADALLDDVYPGYEYLLHDEVQNVENWEVWVGRLYRRSVLRSFSSSTGSILQRLIR